MDVVNVWTEERVKRILFGKVKGKVVGFEQFSERVMGKSADVTFLHRRSAHLM